MNATAKTLRFAMTLTQCHTYGTQAASQGVSLDQVQATMVAAGHAPKGLTMQRITTAYTAQLARG